MRWGLKRLTAAMLVAALAGLFTAPAMALHPKYRAGYQQACSVQIAEYMRVGAAYYAESGSVWGSVQNQQVLDGNEISESTVEMIEGSLVRADERGRTGGDEFARSGGRLKACGLRYLLPIVREEEAAEQRAQEQLLEQHAELQRMLQQQRADREARQAQQSAKQQQLAEAEPVDEIDESDSSPSPMPAKPEKKVVKAQPAHDCVDVEQSDNSYGQFINICEFDVQIAFCNIGSPKGSWAEQFACEVGKGAGVYGGIRAHGTTGAHVNGATYTYWFACRDSYPTGLRYEAGRGLVGRCG
jgi:hypothetical protein